MVGNLSCAPPPSCMRAWAIRPTARRVATVVLASVFAAVMVRAAEPQPAGGEMLPAPALSELDKLRQRIACTPVPLENTGQGLVFRGRPALEIKGRERAGAASGAIRDFAVVDLPTSRIVFYACFVNASTRQAGEPIISLSEISTIADARVRAILPGMNLVLESIQRYRASGMESVYYESRYATAEGEFPFLVPPVRLLLNATTGSLFRLDIDPDWLDPVALPRTRISRQSAERIANVVLAGRDLAGLYGAGTVFGKTAAAELFMVHPNGWQGFGADEPDARARLAWVVPFRLNGGSAPGMHSLFVDAATGRVIGGLSSESAGHPQR